MRCPYRMNEVYSYHDEKTWVSREFAYCYREMCPYFDDYPIGICRKVANENGCYAKQEVD